MGKRDMPVIRQSRSVSPSLAGCNLPVGASASSVMGKGSQPPPSLPGFRLLHTGNAFDLLHDGCMVDYRITGSNESHVFLAIALPHGTQRHFVHLLESLAGFFHILDGKERSQLAQVKARSPEQDQEAEKNLAERTAEVCTLFDNFTSQGLTRNDAVKLTNSTLKASGKVWSTHEVVSWLLRKAGRFRRQERGKP